MLFHRALSHILISRPGEGYYVSRGPSECLRVRQRYRNAFHACAIYYREGFRLTGALARCSSTASGCMFYRRGFALSRLMISRILGWSAHANSLVIHVHISASNASESWFAGQLLPVGVEKERFLPPNEVRTLQRRHRYRNRITFDSRSSNSARKFHRACHPSSCIHHSVSCCRVRVDIRASVLFLARSG